MNIAVYSPNFHPLTGGLENAVLDLATEFDRQGHPTTVITLTPADAPDAFPFRVLRRPGFFQQVMAMRRADVVLMFNVGLETDLGMLLRYSAAGGLAGGLAAATVAVLPHLLAQTASIPWPSLAATLALVLAAGLITGLIAVRAVLTAPLLSALRSE